ncbi:hypothetical protein Moror_15114 [Moniliophthora roreri MCA 2997]|uniref:Uncharacterized protein n=1 Tax=Moniliophthora roreri (strain MCA 2997) TaxID=1381753 RepID=V2X2X4_MONRO|nr:hypothetical protein Moror_15114 [Moniliophthora roreri MCA 2997]
MSGLRKTPTPPPAYTPSASSNLNGTGASSNASTPFTFDSQSPYHNPWSSAPVFNGSHHYGTANPHQPLFHPPPLDHSHHWQQGSGPTPAQQLHIPYAYYDPRSEHSVMQADARAKRRFFEAFAWVVVTWLVVGLLVQAYMEGRFQFEWGKN